MIVDVHSHLTFPELKKDLGGILERAKQAGVVNIISSGTSMENNQEVLELSKKYNLPYFSGDPISIIANKGALDEIKKRYGDYQIYGGCTVGISYIFFNNCGEIAFCPMLNKITLSDLKTESIKEVWDKSEIYLRMRNRDLAGKCKTCKFVMLCGGCCAYGFWKTGKLFSENPICTFYEGRS